MDSMISHSVLELWGVERTPPKFCARLDRSPVVARRYIRGTNGFSNGLVPMLRVTEEPLPYVFCWF